MKKLMTVSLCVGVLIASTLYADNDRDNTSREEYKRGDNHGGHTPPPKYSVPQKRTPYVVHKEYQRVNNERYIPKNIRPNEYNYHYVEPHYRMVLPPERRSGWVIYNLPSAAFILAFGGITYYYHEGIFYHPSRGAYIVVNPPLGMIVPSLPMGYSMVRVYNRDYFFYDNIYYEWAPSYNGYRVVELPTNVTMPQNTQMNNPIGTIYYDLPRDSEVRIINGVQYYYFEGQYLLSTVQNGNVVYVVVNPQ
ncbi:MAG: hypothetical protein PHN18_01425 [Sulfurospirillaceae bacterium]|nr:hypothetical protein [Sulfurospirillaceae bacterium]MDD2825999.1 hypothetical protein [Sulfurospirillaceae bacterium]